MKFNIPRQYPVYEMGYNNEYPIEQLFLHNFNVLPSKYTNNQYYNIGIVDFLVKSGFDIISEQEIISNLKRELNRTFILLNKEKEFIINVFKFDEGLYKVVYFYNRNKGEFNNQIDTDLFEANKTEKKKSNINLITSIAGNMQAEEFEINVKPIDIKLNYGESFVKKHNLIYEKLTQDNGKGIVLLYGIPGSGKSTYLRYLTSIIENKEILFIPPSMAEALSDPSIIPFLMDYKNSILIIEDSERVISDRENNGSSIGVSNILNITDGILGDCLNIQIIATFNMEKERIDRALLRKGRLICEHKFDELSIDDTNILLKHLGKDRVVNEKMVLADIYNIDEEFYKEDNKKLSIGFR